MAAEKNETCADVEADEADATVEGATIVMATPSPKDICTDFVADELSKIVAQLSLMNADMTEEEHADAMASLLLLRDEARYVIT